jgi:hypothetical protein
MNKGSESWNSLLITSQYVFHYAHLHPKYASAWRLIATRRQSQIPVMLQHCLKTWRISVSESFHIIHWRWVHRRFQMTPLEQCSGFQSCVWWLRTASPLPFLPSRKLLIQVPTVNKTEMCGTFSWIMSSS